MDFDELVVKKSLDVGMNTPLSEVVVELGKIVKHTDFITRAGKVVTRVLTIEGKAY